MWFGWPLANSKDGGDVGRWICCRRDALAICTHAVCSGNMKPGRKLLEQGGPSCTDADIVAILLGSGGRGYTALDSANALLDKYGTLSALMNRTLEEIAGIRGIKATRAIRLAAAYELCRRLLKEIDRDA